MTPALYTFESHPVRVIDRDGEPWFVLADVCRVLDIANSRDAAARLDDEEKGVGNIDTLGGPQESIIINESGLYSVILTSRKPAARRFKKWVTSEVLPAIRKTGGYGQATIRSPDQVTELLGRYLDQAELISLRHVARVLVDAGTDPGLVVAATAFAAGAASQSPKAMRAARNRRHYQGHRTEILAAAREKNRAP